ncbi:MAG: ABC transporter substrate-binding protein [Planctomycetes bacterium]|nr:ABC transporter substrate-binding protein [Planctomycetota bacterium]
MPTSLRVALRSFAVVSLAVSGALAQTVAANGKPTDGEVPLACAPDWTAFLVHDAGAGIWTVKSFDVLPWYGCPEIVGMDDKGRCTILSSYSGKWTPNDTVFDGQWLAPVGHADVDPRREGKELYVGGKSGNLYQLALRGEHEWDKLEIAHWTEEIHTIVAGELRPERPGAELVAFLKNGDVFELVAGGAQGFASQRLGTLPGRVRDAVVVPGREAGAAPRIVTVSRAGEVAMIELRGDGLARTVMLQEPMGFGRVARRPPRAGRGEVFYITRDDGLVLRLEERADGSFARNEVYAGPQGLRGVAAGRFTNDPTDECVAVFGYSARVQLLVRKGEGPWHVSDLFTDLDRGHWLDVAELDGRNGTDELIASGYGGRIVLLARPPGYALGGVATDPVPALGGKPIARIAAKINEPGVRELSPLCYQGGFESKTAVYETLVRRDSKGRIAPALAASWRISDDGRTTTFVLREDARFHDGTPVTSRDVAVHMKRWVGLPEHAWLRSSDRIVAIEALTDRELRVTCDRPVALLPDLCAINPCAIRAPAALDREGAFVRAVGSGPFTALGWSRDQRTLRLARATRPSALLDLVRSGDDDPLAMLRKGEVDVVASSWLVKIDPRILAELRRDAGYVIREGPGSAVRYLSFAIDGGRMGDVALRRRVANAIDRAALVLDVEAGFADPCTAWAAPSVSIWPQPAVRARDASLATVLALTTPLRLAAPPSMLDLARAVGGQLGRDGIAVDVVETIPRGAEVEADLRIETTWGVPYDPELSLIARFGKPLAQPSAASPRARSVDPRVQALVEQLVATPQEKDREVLFARIQTLLDEEVLIVPLYAQRRATIVRAGLPEPPVPDHDLYRADWTFLTDRATPR